MASSVRVTSFQFITDRECPNCWVKKYKAEPIRTLPGITTNCIKHATPSLSGTTINIKKAVQSNV